MLRCNSRQVTTQHAGVMEQQAWAEKAGKKYHLKIEI